MPLGELSAYIDDEIERLETQDRGALETTRFLAESQARSEAARQARGTFYSRYCSPCLSSAKSIASNRSFRYAIVIVLGILTVMFLGKAFRPVKEQDSPSTHFSHSPSKTLVPAPAPAPKTETPKTETPPSPPINGNQVSPTYPPSSPTSSIAPSPPVMVPDIATPSQEKGTNDTHTDISSPTGEGNAADNTTTTTQTLPGSNPERDETTDDDTPTNNTSLPLVPVNATEFAPVTTGAADFDLKPFNQRLYKTSNEHITVSGDWDGDEKELSLVMKVRTHETISTHASQCDDGEDFNFMNRADEVDALLQQVTGLDSYLHWLGVVFSVCDEDFREKHGNIAVLSWYDARNSRGGFATLGVGDTITDLDTSQDDGMFDLQGIVTLTNRKDNGTVIDRTDFRIDNAQSLWAPKNNCTQEWVYKTKIGDNFCGPLDIKVEG